MVRHGLSVCDAEDFIPRKYHQRRPGTLLSVQAIETRLNPQQLMSQLTSRIRLYGADCNQTALVVRQGDFLKISSTYLLISLAQLEAIKQTKVDMQVYVGNYVVSDDIAVYQRQRDAIKDALQTYGTDHVAGITVGNEFMLKYGATREE